MGTEMEPLRPNTGPGAALRVVWGGGSSEPGRLIGGRGFSARTASSRSAKELLLLRTSALRRRTCGIALRYTWFV